MHIILYTYICINIQPVPITTYMVQSPSYEFPFVNGKWPLAAIHAKGTRKTEIIA